MAEALGTAASIIAVLNLAGTVVKYLTSVHNAPKERENVFREISSITSVLFLVQGHSERGCNDEESTLSSSARSLGTPGGPLEQFKAALETLAYKFSPRGVVKRVGRVLLWPFEKGEIAELLLSLERLKTRFLLALQSDNLYGHRYTLLDNLKRLLTSKLVICQGRPSPPSTNSLVLWNGYELAKTV